MHTFLQFLQERFFKGADLGSAGYVEFYVNPSASEVDELFREMSGSASSKMLAGFLSAGRTRKIYVWDREQINHAEAFYELVPPGTSAKDWWPFYLRKVGRNVELGLASYGMIHLRIDSANKSGAEALFRNHPIIKDLGRKWNAQIVWTQY